MKYHKLSGLKHQIFILSQFWKPTVWNHGVWGTREEAVGEVLWASPSFSWPQAFFGCDLIALVFAFPVTLSSFFLCVSLSLSSMYWLWHWGTTKANFTQDFEPNYICKDPFFQISNIYKFGGFRSWYIWIVTLHKPTVKKLGNN